MGLAAVRKRSIALAAMSSKVEVVFVDSTTRGARRHAENRKERIESFIFVVVRRLKIQ